MQFNVSPSRVQVIACFTPLIRRLALEFRSLVDAALKVYQNWDRRHVFPACERLGLPRATWLTFRRTYSSWSHDKGVPGKVVAQLMGHAIRDRERITTEKAMIGSCTKGSYDDCRPRSSSGTCAPRAPRAWHRTPRSAFSAANRSPACSVRPAERFASRGAVHASVRAPAALPRGQRAITPFNRNWQNRMGLGGEGYLASPAVVAASALTGYMAPPSELGLRWDPELYGV